MTATWEGARARQTDRLLDKCWRRLTSLAFKERQICGINSSADLRKARPRTTDCPEHCGFTPSLLHGRSLFWGNHNTHLFLCLEEKERRRRTTANPSWQNNSWSWRNNTVRKRRRSTTFAESQKETPTAITHYTHTPITQITLHRYTTKARPDVFVTEAHR